MQSAKLRDKFKTVNYDSSNAVVRHVLEISKEIAESERIIKDGKVKARLANRTELKKMIRNALIDIDLETASVESVFLKVKKLVPDEKKREVRAAICELLRQSSAEKRMLKENETSETQLFASASKEEVETAVRVARDAMRRPTVYNWWVRRMPREAAENACIIAALKALKTFNLTKGAGFDTHLLWQIRGALSTENRKWKRLVNGSGLVRSLNEPINVNGKELQDLIPDEQSFESKEVQRSLEELIRLSQKRRVGNYNIALWALKRFGHSNAEIARHFSCSREIVRRHVECAARWLSKS